MRSWGDGWQIARFLPYKNKYARTQTRITYIKYRIGAHYVHKKIKKVEKCKKTAKKRLTREQFIHIITRYKLFAVESKCPQGLISCRGLSNIKDVIMPFIDLIPLRYKVFCYKTQEVNKLSANFEAKKVVVQEITDKIKAAKSVVFVDYNKLTVAEVSQLRNECKKSNSEYKVYKNTLVRKAFNDLGFNQFDADLNGPTAVVFANDETSAAKVMLKASKDYQDKIVIKSAFVDNSYVDKDGVKALATMPSKEELIAKMLGSMQAPVANFAGVLSNLMSGIVRVLNGIAQSKAE